MSSRYSLHVEKWRNCKRCLLWEKRLKVVLCRGNIPAPVLIIGEAPGASEDVHGVPFFGPAGHLLDQIIKEANPNKVPICITNLVGCMPKGEHGGKLGEPPEESIRACAPRLAEVVDMCRPKLVVLVGKLSAKWCPKLPKGTKAISLIHPAAVLRLDVSQQGLAIRRCIVTLADALESL